MNARITDIAETAAVAIGSFYTYFRTKEEIFVALIYEMEEELLRPHRDIASSKNASIYGAVESANRDYLNTYQRNAALMAVLEEFSTLDDEFRTIRIRRGIAYQEPNIRSIRRLQERGIADPELDAVLTAHSLGGMVSRAAYQAFVLETSDDIDQLVATLTRLWLNALGIDQKFWSEPL